MIRKPRRATRRGTAAVELAVLLPFLAFLFVIALDWGRLFYYSMVVDNCARNGAVWSSDPYSMIISPYATQQAAARADAPNLSPSPTVTSTSGTDSSGNKYVDCTVTYSFKTLSNFPGVPQTNSISRTVRVYVAPQTPS